MSGRLPPLTALRAFEAAARHMSFAMAAAELNVTPAALSFQIKSLEKHLGAPVFKRINRAVELTEEGALLRPGVEDGFAALQSAWRSVQRKLDSATLTVTAGPGFTAKWLAPRLFSFAQANPDIELRFSASLQMMDFARDDVDVAIRFGQGDDTGLYSRNIIDEWASPMVTPALAERLRTIEDLQELPLLHDDHVAFLSQNPNWDYFFQLNELPPNSDHGPRFSQSDHAIDAALAGAGVVLGRISMTEAHLRDGRLVMPLNVGIRLNASYRLLCPLGSETRSQVARFIDWVSEETKGIGQYAEGVTFLNSES
ncbi:transcriptional regulator GcvA [uncultured Litoreibacter sp.]|uniref:transcriptional regulator GcvA n=1 Tax=uncultured Litoreibacter sp. TaxID=1392394 RepID=UPI00260220C8|nr:transcriptional regulator GcvA [uncultured Litoreibacter sp.]